MHKRQFHTLKRILREFLLAVVITFAIAWILAIVVVPKRTIYRPYGPATHEVEWWKCYISPLTDHQLMFIDSRSTAGIQLQLLTGGDPAEVQVRYSDAGSTSVHIIDNASVSQVIHVECGWPLRCFSGWKAYMQVQQPLSLFMPKYKRPQPVAMSTLENRILHVRDRHRSNEYLVPYGIMWGPFVLNVAVVTFLVYSVDRAVWMMARRRANVRIRLGRCPHCGYPMGDSSRCSECGEALKLGE